MLPARPRVFISYARTDGETVATALRARLEREHPDIGVWQDRAQLEGGVGWWKQITDALDVVEFLVLVMTPAALASPVARKEWRYARLQGVCVYPVQAAAAGQVDFAALPAWMRKAHFFDLEGEWDTFIHHLKSPCRAARVPFMAPDLPSPYVPRKGPMEQLLTQLLDRSREQPVAITTALRGAGGLGKTTLAAALCHEDVVISAFDDGVLWVTLGQRPNLVEALVKLHSTLTGERTGFVDEEDASFHLAERLEDKNCLIVIDDVWQPEHLEPFLRGGRGCTRLITTRNFEIAADAARVDVDQMTDGEAISLLTDRLNVPADQLSLCRDLARRLGEWPLLLELANASLRQRVERGDSVSGALRYVSRKLEQQGLTAFDQRNATARSRALTLTLELSLQQFDQTERTRYEQLSIFPEDVPVPVAHSAALWGLLEFDAVEMLQRLDDQSLLKLDLHNATFQLHDVLRGYASSRLADPASAHRALWQSWRDLRALPDAYAWQWVAHHLVGAGAPDTLRDLLLDFQWLLAKLDATDVTALLADLKSAHEDDDVRMVEAAVRLSAHVLARDERQLAGQLLGRLPVEASAALTALRGAAARWKGGIWIAPLEPTLAAPGDALLFTLTGHAEATSSVAITPDGQRAVSASNDATIRVWDLTRAVEERCLAGHRDWVRAVALTADGRLAVSASDDQTLRLWDLREGSEHAVLDAQGDWLRTVAISPDGREVYAAGDGRRIFALEVATGRPRCVMTGHTGTINAILLTRDGARLISASDDRTVRVWNVATGEAQMVWRGHTSRAVGIALSADESQVASVGRDDVVRSWRLRPLETEGRLVASDAYSPRTIAFADDGHSVIVASDDASLTVIDWESGTRRRVHEGHADWVNAIAVTPDGDRFVSASNDRTLKVWSTRPDERPRFLKGHADRVRAIACSADGRVAVSTGDDRRLRVWDVASREERQVWRGHSHWPVALTPDGARVVIASGDGTVSVIDVESAQVERVLTGHEDRVRCVAVSPDGQWVVAGGDDRTIRIWSLANGIAMTVIPTDRHWVRRLAIVPGTARIISASEDRTLKVWDMATGAETLTMWRHDARVNAVAVSPGGLVFSGSDDTTVRLWRLDNAVLVRTIAAHRARVNVIAQGPRADEFVSVSDDFSVRLWQVHGTAPVCTFTAEAPVTACAIGCDDTIIVGDQSGRIHFLRAERADPPEVR